MVTIASAQACGYRGDADVKLAASVEFMHTATLFHDDVVDESDTRRGKRTARLVWGNQESVLVGDFLLGQAFKMMVEVGSLEALEVLVAAAATIAEGEVMQLTTAKNTETTEDEYLDVDSRQDRGALLRRGGGRRDRRRRGAQRALGLPLLRRQSRHRLPARSTTRSITAARPRRSARTSATISARER